MKYARIIDSVAVEVCTQDPYTLYHPDVAVQFETVPDEVEVGWYRDGEMVWHAPEPIPEDPADLVYPTIRTTDYTLLYTPDERILLKESTDPYIVDHLQVISDVRRLEIDLNQQWIQNAVNYIKDTTIIAPGRVEQILLGQLAA